MTIAPEGWKIERQTPLPGGGVRVFAYRDVDAVAVRAASEGDAADDSGEIDVAAIAQAEARRASRAAKRELVSVAKSGGWLKYLGYAVTLALLIGGSVGGTYYFTGAGQYAESGRADTQPRSGAVPAPVSPSGNHSAALLRQWMQSRTRHALSPQEQDAAREALRKDGAP